MSRAEQFDRLDFDLDDDEEGEAEQAVVVVSAPTMPSGRPSAMPMTSRP